MKNDKSEYIKQFKDDESKSKLYSTIVIVSICIIIGVPIWWTTTIVYRATLPYEEIGDLKQFQNNIKINLELIICGGTTSPSESEQLLSRNINKNGKLLEGLSIRYKLSSRNALRDEISTLKACGTIKECDLKLSTTNSETLHVFLIPESMKPNTFTSTKDILIGHKNFVYVYMDNKGISEPLASRISKTVKMVLANEKALENTLISIKNRTIKNNERLRSFSYSHEYDIVFTLMNSLPNKVKWNIKRSVNNYMTPLIDSLNPYSKLNIVSQVVYHNDIGVRPIKMDDRYTLTIDQLPIVINAVEPYLGSHTSINPTLNIVVYSPAQYSPLYLIDKDKLAVPSNAFLSSRWGAFLIANAGIKDTDDDAVVSLDDRAIMATALSQIRDLLGFRNSFTDDEIDDKIEIQNPGNKIISEWELNQWVLLRCYSNLVTSTSTLHALSTLLEDITNIVINDEIGQTVEEALQAIYKTRHHLRSGDIKKAFEYSKKAFIASEKAFFDPSLLGLLYFPEEQKFAIYVPLFLPIAMSFILSAKELIQYLKAKKNPKKID